MTKFYFIFHVSAAAWFVAAVEPVVRRTQKLREASFLGSERDASIFVEATGRMSYNSRASPESSDQKSSIGEAPSLQHIEIIFIKNMRNPMSDMVRGDEMSIILGSPQYKATHGDSLPSIRARSVSCESYRQEECNRKRDGQIRVAVHLKWPCMCGDGKHAMLADSLHVLDPVDESIKYGGLNTTGYLQSEKFCARTQTTPCISGLFVNTEMSHGLATKVFDSRFRDVLVSVMPHHHGNFEGRRHKVKANTAAVNLTTAGTIEATAATKLYKFTRAHKLHMCHPAENSSMMQSLGPIKRGDFFASWTAENADIGVAWTGSDSFYKKHLDAALMEKPSQRLVNLLAVGVPTVADSRIQSFRDVQRLGLGLPGAPEVLLADSIEDLMSKIEMLRVNATLRERVARAGLQIAEAFSPASVAQRYEVFIGKLVKSANHRAGIH